MYGLTFCFTYEVLKLYVHYDIDNNVYVMLGLLIAVTKVEQ